MGQFPKILEALNAAALVPAIICLVLLVRYIRAAAIARGLRPYGWIHLPPSMNLALAMLIFDVAVIMRLLVTVAWYAIGLQIIPVQAMFLIAIILIIFGLLCKIRALTQPDYGRISWVLSMIGTIVAGSFWILLFW
jgi:hypothetical protein